MKVRCIFDKHSEVPELIEKYGYLERSILHITKGKEYTVYAIIGWQLAPIFFPSVEYIIQDDMQNDISGYSAKLFEVVEDDLGDCDWRYSYGKHGINFIIGYDEFVNNRDHYEGVLLNETEDRKKFMSWCEIVDAAISKK
jgi:hypothetical protein